MYRLFCIGGILVRLYCLYILDVYIYIYTYAGISICHALRSWLKRPPELLRNMTLWGCNAREIAAVTSVGSNITEQPLPSLPTGQTNGIVPQSRLHWRRLASTAIEGGALPKKGEVRGWRNVAKGHMVCVCQTSCPATVILIWQAYVFHDYILLIKKFNSFRPVLFTTKPPQLTPIRCLKKKIWHIYSLSSGNSPWAVFIRI